MFVSPVGQVTKLPGVFNQRTTLIDHLLTGVCHVKVLFVACLCECWSHRRLADDTMWPGLLYQRTTLFKLCLLFRLIECFLEHLLFAILIRS